MKKSSKRITAGVLALSVLWGGAAALGVTVDGAPVAFGSERPFVDENNRTLVPMRALAEALDIQVRWDNDTRTAEFYKEWTAEKSPWKWGGLADGTNQCSALARRVLFSPDSAWYTVERTDNVPDGAGALRPTTEKARNMMDTEPVIKDGRLYAPIRYLAPEFFFDVDWEDGTQTVRLLGASPSAYAVESSMEGGVLRIVLQGLENMTSARILSLTVASQKITGQPAPEPGTPDYQQRWAEYDALRDARSAAVDFTADTPEQLAALNRPEVLAGVQTPFAFEAGRSYTIIFTFAYTTESGAQREESYSIAYEPPA